MARERWLWAPCLLLLSALQARADVTLTLTAPKPQVMVSEPTKVYLTWTSDTPTNVFADKARLLLDDGTGYKQYLEGGVEYPGEARGGPDVLAPAQPIKVSYVMAVSGGRGELRPAFPAVGLYRIKVRYRGVSSNEVSIRVVAPQGRDAELHTRYLRDHPDILTDYVVQSNDPGWGNLANALAEYDASQYLDYPKLFAWRRRIREAVVQFGASGGPSRSRTPLEEGLGQLLSEIEGDAWPESPFDPDRLLLVAQTRLEWGGLQGVPAALAAYRGVVTRHPETPEAELARQMIAKAGDVVPPAIEVVASPRRSRTTSPASATTGWVTS